ncbi:MAG: TonB-dependent receptor [Bacteroidetes bacterium]|nr:TonB-dependent receptor [Bacteroidota bacterium]
MKFKIAVLLITLVLSNIVYAQTASISGTIIANDDKNALAGVSVSVINTGDSAQKKGTVTDADGFFTIDNLKAGKYKIRISSVGFKPTEKTVTLGSNNVSLGQITLQASSSSLKNVTVETKQIRAEQKGDTTEFNANAFKTHPDATTEDLVNKMPGISTQDGTLKANGEQVKQVLLDGKPFFGDDVNTAIKNLPAEVVDKIQVFDKLSDQAQFTGFDDGNSQKTINITTRQGKNNGTFGRVYAGYGTDDRYLAGGNINYFKGARRISLLGLFNNVNQQNFSTDDLLGVTGGSSGQNRGGFQRGGGGAFGGRGGNQNFGGGDGAGNFLVGQQGGIATTNAVGLNYSDNWGKKIKVTGSYFFNSSNTVNNTTLTRQYLTAQDSNITYNEKSTANQKNQNHRANLRLEYEIDSSNSIVLQPRFSYQINNSSSSLTGANTLPGDIPYGNTQTNNAAKNDGYTFSNNLLYRHKFKKRGRTISLNINTQLNNKDGDGTYYSANQLPSDTNIIDQRYDLKNNGYTLAPSLNYTEPISKKGQLQVNYSPSFTSNTSDKETFDKNTVTGEYSKTDTLLSNKYDNTYNRQRGGISYRYNNMKTSFNIGVDADYAELSGSQTYPHSFSLSKTFTNILPNAMFNRRYTNGKNLRIMYRTSTDAPSISQLQSVVDISNPLLLKTGNPDLKQSYTNNLIIRYGATNAKTAHSFFVFAYASYVNNYIGNATYIPRKDTIINSIAVNRGSQISLPVNLDGNVTARTFATYGLPVKWIKSNLNLNAGFNYTRTPGMINYATNLLNNYAMNGGVTLSSNISEKIDFTLSYNGSYNIAENTLQTQSNNTYYSQTTSLRINWLPYKGFVLNTNLLHTLYSGLTQSYNQDYLLWNASIGYKFLKNRALEAKVSVYDLLDQNRAISRTVTETYIEDSYTNVLKQYFMFTLTYTLRNFKGAMPNANNNASPWGGMQPNPGRWRD